MIESVHFKNYKALRDCRLPLGPCTLLVGANSSGKSTAIEALRLALSSLDPGNFLCKTADVGPHPEMSVTIRWGDTSGQAKWVSSWDQLHGWRGCFDCEQTVAESDQIRLRDQLERMRIFSLIPRAIAEPCAADTSPTLDGDGGGLAGVLEMMQRDTPQRFDALAAEFYQWFPEFDRILIESPTPQVRSVSLRTTRGQQPIAAADLSEGVLLTLTILTISYLADPPPLIGFEEPDRGIHPRLLPAIRDALYRLSYPKELGQDRATVQVIATTHSPYLLDLFREHPEEIVVSQRADDNVCFERLTDQPYFEEVVQDTPLGAAWYSGILGGVPTES